jgi:hypothetical protein
MSDPSQEYLLRRNSQEATTGRADVLMGNWLVDWCCVVPGTSVGNVRLSGMVVRKSYFTAIALDENGVLFITVKKMGLWHICLLFDASGNRVEGSGSKPECIL